MEREEFMTKVFIEKKNIYAEIIQLIEQSQRSVRFYSISCCFGFYSEGLVTYEKVLLAIKNALLRKVDVKILAKVDYNNLIDVYAARCFAVIEMKETGLIHQDGLIFRELGIGAEKRQFLVADQQRILRTSFQEDVPNETLDLVLNPVEGGTLYGVSDDPNEFNKDLADFKKIWENSPPLQVEAKPVSRNIVRLFLRRWTAIPETKNEYELGQLLTGYLHGMFSRPYITVKMSESADRIEILVRNQRRHERYGVEFKLKPDNEYADEIVGKLADSQEQYDGGFELVIVHPKYTPEKGRQLRERLSKIDIGLIELK